MTLVKLYSSEGWGVIPVWGPCSRISSPDRCPCSARWLTILCAPIASWSECFVELISAKNAVLNHILNWRLGNFPQISPISKTQYKIQKKLTWVNSSQPQTFMIFWIFSERGRGRFPIQNILSKIYYIFWVFPRKDFGDPPPPSPPAPSKSDKTPRSLLRNKLKEDLR